MKAIACMGDPHDACGCRACCGISGHRYQRCPCRRNSDGSCLRPHQTSGLKYGKIAIATTRYVVEDKSANFIQLTTNLGVPVVYVADPPGFGKSSMKGLHRYETGTIKEGAGAGGACTLQGFSVLLRTSSGQKWKMSANCSKRGIEEKTA